MSKSICHRCHRPNDNGRNHCDRCLLLMRGKRGVHQKKAVDPFYKSAAWLKARAYKLSIDPLCEDCKAGGVTRQAFIVDHIREIKDGGALLEFDNLRSLCMGCHNRKTRRESKKRG
jgi:5-methylcytosine-specific restriction endonuclease McrA